MDIAKIAGTLLAMFTAMVVFALNDKNVVDHVREDRSSRFVLKLVPAAWVIVIIVSLLAITIEQPDESIRNVSIYGMVFSFAIILVSSFWAFYELVKVKLRALA